MHPVVLAVALLVAGLAFEAAVFRYVGTSDGAVIGDAGQVRTEAPGGDTSPGRTDDRECPNCHAVNADGTPVRYCRECLARL